MATLSDKYQDLLISHQIGVERLKSRQVRDLILLYNKGEGEYVDLLESGLRKLGPLTVFNFRSKKAQINKLLSTLDANRSRLWDLLFDQLEVRLGEIAEAEVVFNENSLIAVTAGAAAVDKEPVNKANITNAIALVLALPFLGKTLANWTESIQRSERTKIKDIITQSIINGESTSDIVDKIIGTRKFRFKDGAFQKIRKDISTITRSGTSHSTTIGKELVWKANTAMVTGVKWSAVLDGKTSALCRTLDGGVGPILGEPDNLPTRLRRIIPLYLRPPAHLNCRSIVVAIINGIIPNEVTYEAWLMNQPASVQDDILGDLKGKLFRDGDLALDRFSDLSGKEYTIAELRKRDQQAFIDAKI